MTSRDETEGQGERCRAPRSPALEEKVAFLSRPEAYRERPRDVTAVETHMSWVFLTDCHAYKLKKPIRYDVLDFGTLDRRRRSCRRELRLNRRLAPHVYLAVVPLALLPDGGLRLGGSGTPVEWLVKMRRLPAERMLDRVIENRSVHRSDVQPAAELLAEFYAGAVPATIEPEGYRQHLLEGALADREELTRPFYGLPAREVHRISDLQQRYLDDGSRTLGERVRERRIVEGHGDLRPEHISLADPPAVIDCLEFSRDLRILDPTDELSFLSLECARLGAPRVGEWFFDVYRDVTGDDPAAELILFYRRFRALRRAKIAIWHLREPDVDRAEEWRARATWYIEAAAPTSV